MKKTKIEKDLSNKMNIENKITGITLIALVITIIGLLILAGITVAQLSGNGLFDRTKLAKEKYKNSMDMENSIIDNYGQEISNNRDTVTIPREDYEKIMQKINNKQYGYFFNNSMTNVGNEKIAFQKDNGNMEYDSSAYKVKLKKGINYYISFSCRTYDDADWGDLIIYNETESKDIKRISWSTNWIYNTTQLMYTPNSDIEISIKNNMSSSGRLYAINHSSLTIYEI